MITDLSVGDNMADKLAEACGERYSVGTQIGRGACGAVYAATDAWTGQKVAIKRVKMHDALSAKRTLREVEFLAAFRHANVLNVTDLMLVRRTIFLVMPRLDTDLGRVIRSSQTLTPLHVQYFTEQTLDGLSYLHESCNVMHRDLKPANILVNEDCELRISDFGLARLEPSAPIASSLPAEGEGGLLTEYVVTRWYRAPELVLCSPTYTKAVDLWSVGCILAELIGRKPIFPGSSHCDQLERILTTLGSPAEDEVRDAPSGARRYLAGLERRTRSPVSWAEGYPDADPLARDLLASLLQWDPRRRPSVREALGHPYLGVEPNGPGQRQCLDCVAETTAAEADPFAALEAVVSRFRHASRCGEERGRGSDERCDDSEPVNAPCVRPCEERPGSPEL